MRPDLWAFVDRMGLTFDELGGTRTQGRIVGYLLVCDPPERSEAQLCSELGISKGAVNTTIRLLVRLDMLEKVVVPGQRATYYRMARDGWTTSIRAKFTLLSTMQEAARQGLRLLADAPPERRERLERFHRFYDYMSREIEPVLARWEDKEGR